MVELYGGKTRTFSRPGLSLIPDRINSDDIVLYQSARASRDVYTM